MITHGALPQTTAALAWLVLLAGCGLEEGERFGRAGSSEGLLRVHLREPVVELDPARARTPLERAISRQLFSGLVEIEDGRPTPSLASAWSQEGSRLLLRLREDARFSDGTPLTAHDVVWSWQRALRSSTGASDLRLLATIANGAALARGTLLRIAPSHDGPVTGQGAPYAVFRDGAPVDGKHAFEPGTPVRVVDTNARVARPSNAGVRVSVPLSKSPDDTAFAGAALVPGEVATVIGLVETKGGVMLQVRASGGAAGWAAADSLTMHVPAISVVPVVQRGGQPPELHATGSTTVLATLRDESPVEVIERGASLSVVVDVASGKTGTIDSAFLEDTLRERRWFLVETLDASGRGWVSEQDLAFDPALLDVVARDERTLDVGLAVDIDRALIALAAPVARPVPRRVVEEHGRAWTDPGTLVTSGPFTIIERERDRLVLGRAPSSFEAPRARLTRVELVYLHRPTTALHLYRAGLLDVLLDGALPKELAGTLSRAGDFAAGALGGALIAPEVNGLDGSALELRGVFVEPSVSAP